MTNHDMDSSTPFATILVGQPACRHRQARSARGPRAADHRPLPDEGHDPRQTASYIRHHLEQAGRTAELFTDEAITQIHQAARGKPRTVNNICTAALIATAGAGRPRRPRLRQGRHRRSHRDRLSAPRDTLNTRPRPAAPGGAFTLTHALTSDEG